MNQKKFPPYGKAAADNPETTPDRAVIVCTGSQGFSRAKSAQVSNWCGSIRHKLALPFHEAPESYKWPVHGCLVWVSNFGAPEPLALIQRLARCCLECGALRVIYTVDNAPMIRFLPSTGNKEAA